jgi:hypothetical protein
MRLEKPGGGEITLRPFGGSGANPLFDFSFTGLVDGIICYKPRRIKYNPNKNNPSLTELRFLKVSTDIRNAILSDNNIELLEKVSSHKILKRHIDKL